MDIQKEKEAFESVFTEAKGWDLTFIMGCYQNIETLRAFAGWLAAKAQAVPEGFVLVLKEPTDKTIAHMINTPIEVNLLCDHADIFLSEGEAYIAYQAMIEAQEPAND